MAEDRSGVPGGGLTRTSWFERDLPAMWRTLENQQSDDHWRLVDGWRKASELTAIHLRHLQQYRANLAGVWPPDRNAAAAAYVARLDFLIDNVRTTHEVAAANYSTLAATVGALAAARRDLKPLHDEWVAASRAIKEHADRAAFNAAAEGPTVIGAAPVGVGVLERLEGRARAIMYALSHTLIEAEAAIRQPPTYQPRIRRDGGDPDAYGDPEPKAGGTAGSPLRPDATPSSKQIIQGSLDRPGLSPPSSDDIGSGLKSERSAEIPPIPGNSDRADRTRRFTASDPSPTEGSRQTAKPRPLPSGGIIGPMPHAPDVKDPHGATRINPVGGLISPPRLPRATDDRGAIQPVYGPVTGSSPDRDRRRISPRTAEYQWTVPEGVPPVIEPRSDIPSFDPGPAIGLEK